MHTFVMNSGENITHYAGRGSTHMVQAETSALCSRQKHYSPRLQVISVLLNKYHDSFQNRLQHLFLITSLKFANPKPAIFLRLGWGLC